LCFIKKNLPKSDRQLRLELGARGAGGYWIVIGQANQEPQQYDEARLMFKHAKLALGYKNEAKQG